MNQKERRSSLHAGILSVHISDDRNPVETKKNQDAVGEELTGFGESGRYLNRTVLKK